MLVTNKIPYERGLDNVTPRAPCWALAYSWLPVAVSEAFLSLLSRSAHVRGIWRLAGAVVAVPVGGPYQTDREGTGYLAP